MKSKTQKQIRVDRILRFDIDDKDFRFFKSFFETYLTEDMIENEKNEQIKGIIAEKLPWEYQKDWVVVFGRDLAYNMQAKKKNLLIFKLGKLAFFVFKGKYLDMPVAETVEYFEEGSVDPKKLELFKENRIQILDQKAPKHEEFAKNIQTWLAKFCVKYETKMQEDYNEFEKLLVKKLKVELMLEAKEGFWNVFMGPRVNYVTENVKDETEASFSLDLTGGKVNKGKKNVIVFQKKGDTDPYMQIFKNRRKEAVGFLGMLMLFLILVTCRGYELPKEQIQMYEVGGGFYVQYTDSGSYHDLLCMNQRMATFIAGAVFFLYIGAKIFGAVQKKRKVKRMKFF